MHSVYVFPWQDDTETTNCLPNGPNFKCFFFKPWRQIRQDCIDWKEVPANIVYNLPKWVKMLDVLIIIATFCQKSTEGSDCMRQHWFVCLGFFVPLENFLLIWRRHHYRWRTASSALLAIEQWGLFSVQHLLWYMASVYNGHLRGHVTLTPIAERLEVELSLPVFMT